MIVKTFKITLASKTKREMQKDIDYLEMHYGAEEVETSKWTGIDEFPHDDWECSCCGGIVDNIGQWIKDYKFCPRCGTRMIFEEDSE